MSASKALETLLVCTCLAQSALSSGINDDFICNKVVKKFPPASELVSHMFCKNKKIEIKTGKSTSNSCVDYA